MPDYKEMYLQLSRAVEKAVRILTEAQTDCEELFIASSEAEAPAAEADEKEAT